MKQISDECETALNALFTARDMVKCHGQSLPEFEKLLSSWECNESQHKETQLAYEAFNAIHGAIEAVKKLDLHQRNI